MAKSGPGGGPPPPSALQTTNPVAQKQKPDLNIGPSLAPAAHVIQRQSQAGNLVVGSMLGRAVVPSGRPPGLTWPSHTHTHTHTHAYTLALANSHSPMTCTHHTGLRVHSDRMHQILADKILGAPQLQETFPWGGIPWTDKGWHRERESGSLTPEVSIECARADYC